MQAQKLQKAQKQKQAAVDIESLDAGNVVLVSGEKKEHEFARAAREYV